MSKNKNKKNQVAKVAAVEPVIAAPAIPAIVPEVSASTEQPIAPEVVAVVEAPIPPAAPVMVKPSKVARIDALYLEAHKSGTMGKDTAKGIFTIIKGEYSGISEEATMRTIRCRPWHLRQKNLLPASTRGKAIVSTPAPAAVSTDATPAAVTEPALPTS